MGDSRLYIAFYQLLRSFILTAKPLWRGFFVDVVYK